MAEQELPSLWSEMPSFVAGSVTKDDDIFMVFVLFYRENNENDGDNTLELLFFLNMFLSFVETHRGKRTKRDRTIVFQFIEEKV